MKHDLRLLRQAAAPVATTTTDAYAWTWARMATVATLQRELDFDSAFAARDSVLAAHETANPGFCELAMHFIREYLRTHGKSSGEAIVLAGTEAGIVAKDSRAWGVPFRRLSQAGEIVTVDYAMRLRGHGASGARIWALVNQH